MVLNEREVDRLSATLKRSPTKAQATFMHTLVSGEQDHDAPSDDQDAKIGVGARMNPVKTAGGVDARATTINLFHLATGLDIRGRWRMTKADLVVAIDKANRRACATAAPWL